MPRPRQAVEMAATRRRKVRPRATRKTGVAVLLSTGTILLGVLLYLWPQMRLVNLGYHQGALRIQRARVLQRQRELQVEFATLRQLSRVEEIAVQRLGMRPPRMSQIIYMHAGPHLASSGGRR